jgi:cell fate (sporulation/competence/biofilm development) regulator YlbF (YheA/YmcA/DUF963 family)
MQTQLPPELQEATTALADSLLASEAFGKYNAAQELLNNDKQAHALLEELSKVQANFRLRQSDGAISQADVATLRGIQDKVRNNEVIMHYAQSQQAMLSFLKEINADINQLLGINFASFANHATC